MQSDFNLKKKIDFMTSDLFVDRIYAQLGANFFIENHKRLHLRVNYFMTWNCIVDDLVPNVLLIS